MLSRYPVILPCSVLALLALVASIGAQPSFVTPHDTIPNFAYTPTVTSVQSGQWLAPTTWSTSVVPTSTDTVRIKHLVACTGTCDAGVIGVVAGGALELSPTPLTRLTVSTLLVHQGALRIIPPPPGYLTEIVIRDTPLCTVQGEACVFDPFQFGTGILVIDGELTSVGLSKTPTWTMAALSPLRGQTSLLLDTAPTNWHHGDILVIPDTRHLVTSQDYANSKAYWPKMRQWELMTLSGVEAHTLILSTPLQYAHMGHNQFRPHVGNLTRNVVIRSANPAGTRGHTITFGSSTVVIQNTEFRDLGRTQAKIPVHSTTYEPYTKVYTIGTNQNGRYPAHFHRMRGPMGGVPPSGHQFVFTGNSIVNSPRWGLAIHDSSWGLVRDNVCYNAVGACYVTEDGSEIENIIDHNFAVRMEGSGQPEGKEGFGFGHTGTGFWFRQAPNYITNNVAANGSLANFLVYPGGTVTGHRTLRYPTFPGADTTIEGQYINQMKVNVGRRGLNPLRYDNNQSYGSLQSGFEFWRTGGQRAGPFTVSNLVSWHDQGTGVETGYDSSIRIEGLTVGCDPSVARLASPTITGKRAESMGMQVAGAPGSLYEVLNFHITGCKEGIMLRVVANDANTREVLLENGYLKNLQNYRLIPLTEGVEGELINVQRMPWEE